MSGEKRPTEWLPLAILGAVILSVDLAIVVSELISPTVPSAASSSAPEPVSTSSKAQREHGLSPQPAERPRVSSLRAPVEAQGPGGVPRAIEANPGHPTGEGEHPTAVAPPRTAALGRGLMAPSGLGRVLVESVDAGAADAGHGPQ